MNAYHILRSATGSMLLLLGLSAIGAVAPVVQAAKSTVAEIGKEAADIPASPTEKTGGLVKYSLTAKELVANIDQKGTFDYWTYDGRVPGPMLRVREGDTVEITLHNEKGSHVSHTIDFHAATGPGGGAVYLKAAPGEKKIVRFKAKQAGIYIYHCAIPNIPTHISHGMYGLILVEPKTGLSKVDREFYMVQGEMYTVKRPKFAGVHKQDDQRMLDETPTFVVFNGRIGSLSGDRALRARVGDKVRLFFGNAGPNQISSFHIIGEIFDRVFREGDLVSPPARNVQSTVVPAGGAVMVEFTVDAPGDYLLVDHSLIRATNKGALGILKVEEFSPDRIMAPVSAKGR